MNYCQTNSEGEISSAMWNTSAIIFLYVDKKPYILNKNRSSQRHRYSLRLKQFALTLHLLGPSVFKFLQKSLNLHSIRTLRRITSQYKLHHVLNNFIFNFLSFKTANFVQEALDCILCADQISIKTHLFYNILKR